MEKHKIVKIVISTAKTCLTTDNATTISWHDGQLMQCAPATCCDGGEGGEVLGDAALWRGGLMASYTRKMFNEDGK